MEFKSVVKILNAFAPLNLAESWDNVGVLIEPPNMRSVSKLLLTNDLTLAVMDEAEEKGVDMILSYHPPIFKALKAIGTTHWKEQIVGRCLAKGIALYSPHTSYDAIKGGVNDWLIRAFGTGKTTPVQHSQSKGTWTHKVEINEQSDVASATLHQRLSQEFKQNVFLVGNDKTVSVFCGEFLLPTIVASVTSHSTKAQLAISKLEKVPVVGHGSGRKMTLNRPLTLKEATKAAQKHLGLNGLRLAVKHAGTEDDMIKSVAVCAGAGVSVLRGVRCDLVLTGEMSHHDVLDMTQQGTNVILTEHSNCERGFLSAVVQKKLSSDFKSKVQVMVSERDEDPLKIVCH